MRLFPVATEAEIIAPQISLLRGFAQTHDQLLLQGIEHVALQAGFRRMQVPGGHSMSVAMTNCGTVGWVSDRHGYRYSPVDPLSQLPWPEMPRAFRVLASEAAERAGFANFAPDVCLINLYRAGAKLSVHRDADERDFSQPIVSVSLGATARFVIGGENRTDPKQALLLEHGDALVWGGTARRAYHGVGSPRRRRGWSAPLRVNLTFRRAT